MHRISSLPGKAENEGISLVEQPPAEVLFLTSASSDIATIANCLRNSELSGWEGRIRALALSNLGHQAQIDHYLSTTAKFSKLIVVRLLGGRGHWSYGLEQLEMWQRKSKARNLLVLSGTPEEEVELEQLSSINTKAIGKLALLLRVGGLDNYIELFRILERIIKGHNINAKDIKIKDIEDPLKWDWKKEEYNNKAGILMYRSIFQSGDIELAKELNRSLRSKGISPRLLWISGLRQKNIQEAVLKIFKQENVSIVITVTSFASIRFNESKHEGCLWDNLNVPIIQALTSNEEIERWEKSSRGLNPQDLTLQVVLPELDGRITSKPCAFKCIDEESKNLSTVIYKNKPYMPGISWVVSHAYKWIELKNHVASKRKVCITLANYPIRDGRIANGVGLDTPKSLLNVLKWLQENHYDLGKTQIPNTPTDLIKLILSGRTNSPESFQRKPLGYLGLKTYLEYWNTLDEITRKKVEQKWGTPSKAVDLEEEGFAIHGLKLGNISILIQPSRGYEYEDLSDLHSPDLAPPHRYLAQYFWISKINISNILIHLGKHGSAEWLPGKSVGLSKSCFPSIVLSDIPHLYPFIVNDPGEGSQAKRRGNAVILDHLTPPLGRAELYGQYLELENLLDEYFEARHINSERCEIIESKISVVTKSLNLDNLVDTNKDDINSKINFADSFLCELKERQIRTGLHILGELPKQEKLIELLLSIMRCPNSSYAGITQILASILEIDIDPWADNESDLLSQKCLNQILTYTQGNYRLIGDAITWIEDQAFHFLEEIIGITRNYNTTNTKPTHLCPKLKEWIYANKDDPYITYVRDNVWCSLKHCAKHEKDGLMKVISGERLPSGPSGAPTRGRINVLPTGRNFYSVDLRGLPTESAWELGKRSAEKILELHLQDEGEHLKKLALSVWGTSTMRNGGEDISQLLSLIGIQPIWDGPTRRLLDIEVIPLEILQRPRVDVLLRISGLFRDAFPQLISLVHRAQTMISNLDEPTHLNPLAATVKEFGAQGRIYGSGPGSYGAGLQSLIDSGNWETRDDLAEAYITWSQWRYEGNEEPKLDRTGLEHGLKDVEIVMHNQDNREHDILDSDDYYQFHGGLSSAVGKISGQMPKILFGDMSRRERPKVYSLKTEIDKVVRSRILNPKWIEGMKRHGYKGAFEMGASLDYLFSYDATTNIVPDWCYSSILETWLSDESIISFLKDHNPWALRDISERLLEAHNRQLWKEATTLQREKLKEIICSADHIIECYEVNRNIK